MKKKISLLEFEGNPNIGLYFFVNDKFALCGKDLREDVKKRIEDVLGVDILKVSTLDTELVGVFIAGNNEYLFIPELLERELEYFEEISKKFDMKLILIKDKLNTLGNNICVGDKEIIISPDYKKETINFIEKNTDLKIIKLKHENFKGAGSVCFNDGSKYFLSQELDEDNFKDVLDKVGGVGTVNHGSNFISSGVLANKNGILIGANSSTIEIQNIVEALGDLEE
jgi:translation initiation factor 6